MVKRIAILSIMTMIGTSAQAQDCFYRQEIAYKDGTAVEAVQRYDCRNSPPPEIIIVEKEIPAKNRTLGDFLFGVEEESQGVSHLLSTLVSMGVL